MGSERPIVAFMMLALLAFASLGYVLSTRAISYNSVSLPSSGFRDTRIPNANSGINGSIVYDRGAVSCSVPFPSPRGSILVEGASGKIQAVSVKWISIFFCSSYMGEFQITVHPGDYAVSFTGYPLTLPPGAEIGGTNLPLSITVEPHELTQVHVYIHFGI